MCSLNHLHEPAILYNLRRRFMCLLPYTYTGEICIAINPYQWLPLYSQVQCGVSGGVRMILFAVVFRALTCNRREYVARSYAVVKFSPPLPLSPIMFFDFAIKIILVLAGNCTYPRPSLFFPFFFFLFVYTFPPLSPPLSSSLSPSVLFFHFSFFFQFRFC